MSKDLLPIFKMVGDEKTDSMQAFNPQVLTRERVIKSNTKTCSRVAICKIVTCKNIIRKRMQS